MKHPSMKVLQDYFEAEINSKQLIQHVNECERCSLILSEMAKVDVLYQRTDKIEISLKTRESVFDNAKSLLNERKSKTESKSKRKEVQLNTIESIKNFHQGLLNEFAPLLIQSTAAVILIFLYTKISTTQTEIIKYQIIDNNVHEVYSDYQGDQNENN